MLDDIGWIATMSRGHRALGDAKLALGDDTSAHESYRQALTNTQELIQRAPSSRQFQREHAEALEALGLYYLELSKSRRELRQEARTWLAKGLEIWQGWKQQKIGEPYAGRRESRVAALIASIAP